MVRNFIAALLFSVLGPLLTPSLSPPPPPSNSFSVSSVSFLAPPPPTPWQTIANFSHITLSMYSVDLSQTLFTFVAFEKMTFVDTNSARQGLIVCNQYTLYKEADTRDL